MDSIYNTLPGRGFVVRIWPGRYPTQAQRERYGTLLAPWISLRCDALPELCTGYGPDGTDGAPVDDIIMPERSLVAKELDQGRSYFMLQHMLVTDLADEERYPLKVNKMLFADLGPTHAPTEFIYMPTPGQLIEIPAESALYGTSLYRAIIPEHTLLPYEAIHLFVDPAGGGQNGDETSWAVMAFLAGYIYVLDAGGMKGGYDTSVLEFIAQKAIAFKASKVILEPNFGYGTVTQLLIPVLRAAVLKHNSQFNTSISIGAEDGEFVVTQKEERICSALEPLIGGHKLVMNTAIVRSDVENVQHYPSDVRRVFQLLSQMKHITREKNALVHDDRVDVIHQGARYFAKRLARDAEAERAKREARKEAEWHKNPLGRPQQRRPMQRQAPAVSRLQRNR